jgi:hypothetical protein
MRVIIIIIISYTDGAIAMREYYSLIQGNLTTSVAG